MPNINTEPIEVILTRHVQRISGIIMATGVGNGPLAAKTLILDSHARRDLWRAVGFAPCDELGKTHCDCDEDSEPRPLSERPCTGMWRGCQGCDENHLSYAEGVGEYDICKACHWDRYCLMPEVDGCQGTCTVYPAK